MTPWAGWVVAVLQTTLARVQILQALSAASGLRNLSVLVGSRPCRDVRSDLTTIGALTGLTSLELQSKSGTTGAELLCLTSLQKLVSLRWVGLHGPEVGCSVVDPFGCLFA